MPLDAVPVVMAPWQYKQLKDADGKPFQLLPDKKGWILKEQPSKPITEGRACLPCLLPGAAGHICRALAGV